MKIIVFLTIFLVAGRTLCQDSELRVSAKQLGSNEDFKELGLIRYDSRKGASSSTITINNQELYATLLKVPRYLTAKAANQSYQFEFKGKEKTSKVIRSLLR
jgi:hypothetical protein